MEHYELWLAPWFYGMIADAHRKYEEGKINMEFEDLYDMFESMAIFAINFEGEEKTYTHEQMKKILGFKEE